MLIRSATYQDIDRLIEMSARMHGESAYSFLPFDREKVRRLITNFITNPETHCAIVAQDGDVITGMLGGYLTDYFFCKEKLACDVVLFVDQKYRGSSAAIRLIRSFQDWATAHGAREVCLGISTNNNVERTGRFYERMGFTHVGGVYKQRLS